MMEWKPSFIAARNTGAMLVAIIFEAALVVQRICIDVFGRITMARSQTVITSTTKMEIRQITTPAIWNACQLQNISRSILGVKSGRESNRNIWIASARFLNHGMQARRVEQSIEKLARWLMRTSRLYRSNASNASGGSSRRNLATWTSIAAMLARALRVVLQALMMSNAFVRPAVSHSWPIATRGFEHARAVAQIT
jgi:hypothetical protein